MRFTIRNGRKATSAKRLPVLHKLADLIDERVEDLAKSPARRWVSSSNRAAAR